MATTLRTEILNPRVLIDGGTVALTDFGLCLDILDSEGGTERLTDTREAVGSRYYIAPENEGGLNAALDQRPADFYAFGKLTWALLAGRQPLPRERDEVVPFAVELRGGDR
jgi:serine/threonine protein kinase